VEYIDRWSLGLDLKILLRTVPADPNRRPVCAGNNSYYSFISYQ
jgi:lipopolysaccharide/colanic/teichoic acid biosynthesis glycosyltransferase